LPREQDKVGLLVDPEAGDLAVLEAKVAEPREPVPPTVVAAHCDVVAHRLRAASLAFWYQTTKSPMIPKAASAKSLAPSNATPTPTSPAALMLRSGKANA